MQLGFDRRNWLRLAASAAAATALPRWPCAAATAASNPFLLGVASGAPTPDGMVLWTRLLPAGLFGTDANAAGTSGMAADPAGSASTVRWEVADDSAFRRVVRSGHAAALAALGHSVHVEVAGLQPDRWYFYRFMQGHAISATGRTRTAPAAGTLVQRLRMAFASCQRWEDGYYAAWRHLAAEQPDLIIFLGDYIYEYASGKTPKSGAGTAATGNSAADGDYRAAVRTHTLRHARNLSDYRDRYALHHSDPDLQTAHQACPWLITWDDHEVQNDYAGAQGTLSQHASQQGNFLLQRTAAYQAFYENMPLRSAVLAYGPGGINRPDAIKLYQRHAWGRLANFHLLDTRQYRALQACRPPERKNSSAIQPKDCAELRDPQRSLLGLSQENWLDQGLANDATPATGIRWSVIAQQTLLSPRHYPSGLVATDTWDGYPAARSRLLQSVQSRAPRNTVLLGGDIHQNYVCAVKADANREDTPVIASEFCGTSISSNSGASQQRLDAVARHNPHILLARCDQRGYSMADITPSQWTNRLRVVDDVANAQAGVSTLAEFLVQDGRAGPQQTR